MRIAVQPVDDSGCGWYRLRFPAEALNAQGTEIVVSPPGPRMLWDKSWEGLPEPPSSVSVVGLAEPYPFDVIVLQRTGRRFWADAIPLLQAAGTRVVVDVDDALDLIPHRNVVRDSMDPRKDAIHNHAWLREACKRADLVTCATQALVEHYGYGHGVFLPNLVPERYLSIKAEKRPNTIGWSGTVGTHPDDLEVTRGAVQSTLDAAPDWSFHVVGSAVEVAKALGLRKDPSEGRSIRLPDLIGRPRFQVPFDDWAPQVAEIEVGIVPLSDSPFNRVGKSALKAMEFSSLGVPVVMSPTPDNVRMNRHGIGALAASPGQWRRQLRRLTKSSGARTELAGRGRDVMRQWTYEARCGMWLEAWESAVTKPLRKAA